MSKKEYTVGEGGADFASAQAGEEKQVGDQVELDLDADQERAVVAAGWLEPDKKKASK